MAGHYATWKSAAQTIAKKQAELRTAKKAKPVDKDKVKRLEADIAALHANAQKVRKAYNDECVTFNNATSGVHAMETFFA